MAIYQIYEGSDGRWGWRFLDDDDREVLQSLENFERDQAKNEVENLKREIEEKNPQVYKAPEDAKGVLYLQYTGNGKGYALILVNSEGKDIAKGEVQEASEEDLKQIFEIMKQAEIVFEGDQSDTSDITPVTGS